MFEKTDLILPGGSWCRPTLMNYIITSAVVSAAAQQMSQIPRAVRHLYGIDDSTVLMLIGQSFIDVQRRVEEMMKGG